MTERPFDADLDIGKRLRKVREESGTTQAALASKTGISVRHLQKYEAGLLRISARELYDIARVLGVPMAQFFELKDTKAEAVSASANDAKTVKRQIEAAIADVDDLAALHLILRMIGAYRRS
jgi:transcriptional regulator with XRE-family HTH domain